MLDCTGEPIDFFSCCPFSGRYGATSSFQIQAVFEFLKRFVDVEPTGVAREKAECIGDVSIRQTEFGPTFQLSRANLFSAIEKHDTRINLQEAGLHREEQISASVWSNAYQAATEANTVAPKQNRGSSNSVSICRSKRS